MKSLNDMQVCFFLRFICLLATTMQLYYVCNRRTSTALFSSCLFGKQKKIKKKDRENDEKTDDEGDDTGASASSWSSIAGSRPPLTPEEEIAHALDIQVCLAPYLQ
jgi:hypothetical protein